MKRLVSLLAAALCLTACSSNKAAVWYTDYDEAVGEAARQHKNIFMLFSADDDLSGERSLTLKQNILQTKQAMDGLSKNYVLLNLDFTGMSEEADDQASEEEKALYESRQEKLNADLDIASRYSVSSLPSVYLLTEDGYVIAAVPDDPALATPEDYLAFISGYDETGAKINTLVQTLKSAEGIERARTIDDLVETADPVGTYLLADFIREVPALDPDNETGLLGKYILQTAYFDAMDAFITGDVEGAVRYFTEAAEDAHLSAEEKQDAWYSAAYVLFQTPAGPSQQVIEYLERSLAAASQSANAEAIQSTIDNITAVLNQQAGSVNE